MRWLYHDPNNDADAEERVAVLAKIDHWWRAFASRTKDLDDLINSRAQWDLPAWMGENLQAINPNLMWEYGPAVNQEGHRLVITPESHSSLRPLVRAILDRAPMIEGWEFHEYRLPGSIETAEVLVKGRTGGGIDGFVFKAELGEGNRIDLHFKGGSLPEEDVHNRAFVATECILGEEVLNKWIGAIEIASPPRRSRLGRLLRPAARQDPSFAPLAEMKDSVESLMRTAKEALPKEYWSPEECIPVDQLPPEQGNAGEKEVGAVLELQPEEKEEYAGWEDLLVASTGFLELWKATHCDPHFASERFSRIGEAFCYLKLDGTEGLDEEKFEDRQAIHEALDHALIPAGLGATFGGGTGLKYSYLDFVLTDVPKAVGVIRRIMREGNISKRTWIQFFEPELAEEWIGIWDDTPPPPMPPMPPSG